MTTRRAGSVRRVLVAIGAVGVWLGPIGCAPSSGTSPRADREREPTSASLAIGVGDPIVGRTLLADRVLLLTASRQLLELWPASGVTTRRAVPGVGPLDQVRGLAVLDDGSLWTLVGRDEFVEITADRRGRRIRLSSPAVALYGAGDRLVYQAVNFDPPAPALLARRPGGASPQAWGPLQTRPFGRSRAEGMILNLVVCGLGSGDLVPCWFPIGDQVAVVDVSGDGHLIRLHGIRTIAPDDLLTGDVSARPLRDVFARGPGDVWVLGADVLDRPRQASAPDWQVVEFDALGQVRRVEPLEKACRAFLMMTANSAWLLANDGSILKVEL